MQIFTGQKRNTFTADEHDIVSAGTDKTCQVWDVSSGHCVLTYRGHAGDVEGVAWSPHGNFIASGSADRTAHVWEAYTGKLITRYEGHSSIVETVLWSVDGATLAIGMEKEE